MSEQTPERDEYEKLYGELRSSQIPGHQGGGAGDDELSGGRGRDLLIGDDGIDLCSGNEGDRDGFETCETAEQ